MKDKVGILSLGCPRNLVDSENILSRLNLKGYPIVDMAQADIGIVNTCAFIEDAKRESIEAILDLIELKKKKGLKKIIVYGCLTQRYKDALRRELPEVDAFLGRVSLNHSLDSYSLTPRHYAYLKICEGCLNNCSYCVIPKIKGGFTSLDMSSLRKKVHKFNRQGISELNIIGQDITGYGLDLYKELKICALLKDILKHAPKIGWVRLLYLYPSRITDELIHIIADEPKVCKYVDLPIQHINDRILKLMHRQTLKKDILKLIEKIRKRIPQVALRTSVIVGFPSEEDSEFQELLSFIQEIKFERLGAFIYSREEGTPAFQLAGQIPKNTKIARFNAVMSTQQRISQEVNQQFLGQVLDVLIDEKEDGHPSTSLRTALSERSESNGRYLGRSQYDAPEVDGLVYVSSKEALQPGDFVKVKITDTLEYDLVGEVE